MRLEDKLFKIKDKGEASGFFFKTILKKLGWKSLCAIILLLGGIIILVVSFFTGMGKTEK